MGAHCPFLENEKKLFSDRNRPSQGQAHQDDVFGEKGVVAQWANQAGDTVACGACAGTSHLLTISLMLIDRHFVLVSEMHDILRQPAPRIQEDKRTF